MKQENRQSSRYYTFARPSFFEGMARALDLGSTMRIYPTTPLDGYDSDYLALFSDWATVGDDIKEVINQYATETEGK